MARAASKAAFILKHPNKSPAEIVSIAERYGVSLSQSYVHKVLGGRAAGAPAPAASKPATPKPATVKRVTAPAAARPAAAAPVSPEERERHAEFRQLVLRIGTVRAHEWLSAFDNAPVAV